MEKEYKLKITLPEGHNMSSMKLQEIFYRALYEKLKEDGASEDSLHWKQLNLDISI